MTLMQIMLLTGLFKHCSFHVISVRMLGLICVSDALKFMKYIGIYIYIT